MSFVFEILKSEDLTQVNEFLIKHFFSREPLGIRLGIRPETDVSEWLSQVTQPLLDQQVFSFQSFLLLYFIRNQQVDIIYLFFTFYTLNFYIFIKCS